MFAFGPGVLVGTPAGSNQTPVNFGLVQSVSIDETITTKSLFGQNQRALAVGVGTRKTTGKATSARISGLAFGSLYYGITPTPGYTATAVAEAGSIPATPFAVTVANSATWTQDQGVIFATSGLPLKRVASGPTTGQYSVAAGVYTFAAADTLKAVLITYNYAVPAPTGQSLIIGNPLLGSAITFGVNWYMQDPTTGLGQTHRLYNCVATKASFASKLEDFELPTIDFECYVNAAGNLGDWQWADTF